MIHTTVRGMAHALLVCVTTMMVYLPMLFVWRSLHRSVQRLPKASFCSSGARSAYSLRSTSSALLCRYESAPADAARQRPGPAAAPACLLPVERVPTTVDCRTEYISVLLY